MSCAAGGKRCGASASPGQHARGCVVNDGSERTTVVLVAAAGATMRQAFPDGAVWAGSGLPLRTVTAAEHPERT